MAKETVELYNCDTEDCNIRFGKLADEQQCLGQRNISDSVERTGYRCSACNRHYCDHHAGIVFFHARHHESKEGSEFNCSIELCGYCAQRVSSFLSDETVQHQIRSFLIENSIGQASSSGKINTDMLQYKARVTKVPID